MRTAGAEYSDLDSVSEMQNYVTKLLSDGVWRGLNIESLEGAGGSGWSPVECCVFRNFVDWLVNQQDQLWIATYLDAYKYDKERAAATVTMSENTTSRIRVNLNLSGSTPYPSWSWSLFDYPLTLITDTPSGWSSCNVTQNGQTKKYPISNGKVMYQVLPNGEEITLTSGSGVPTSIPTTPPTSTPSSSPADINRDGKVNSADLKLVISVWLGTGNCSGFNCDLNPDSKINAPDATVVLKNWIP